jgi:hypothetical protein
MSCYLRKRCFSRAVCLIYLVLTISIMIRPKSCGESGRDGDGEGKNRAGHILFFELLQRYRIVF